MFKASKIIFEMKVNEFDGERIEGAWCVNRRIIVSVGIGQVGSMFQVAIVDERVPQTFEDQYQAGDVVQESIIFYKKNIESKARDSKIESFANEDLHIAMLMDWLAHEDIRGKSAEEAVERVFYGLMVNQPLRDGTDSILQRYAPQWWEMFVKNRTEWAAKFRER